MAVVQACDVPPQPIPQIQEHYQDVISADTFQESLQRLKQASPKQILQSIWAKMLLDKSEVMNASFEESTKRTFTYTLALQIEGTNYPDCQNLTMQSDSMVLMGYLNWAMAAVDAGQSVMLTITVAGDVYEPTLNSSGQNVSLGNGPSNKRIANWTEAIVFESNRQSPARVTYTYRVFDTEKASRAKSGDQIGASAIMIFPVADAVEVTPIKMNTADTSEVTREDVAPWAQIINYGDYGVFSDLFWGNPPEYAPNPEYKPDMSA